MHSIAKSSLHFQCSKSCGPGFRTRRVSCVGISGFDSNAVEETNCDMTIKPLLQEPCNLGTCNLTWVIGSWSKVPYETILLSLQIDFIR